MFDRGRTAGLIGLYVAAHPDKIITPVSVKNFEIDFTIVNLSIC